MQAPQIRDQQSGGITNLTKDGSALLQRHVRFSEIRMPNMNGDGWIGNMDRCTERGIRREHDDGAHCIKCLPEPEGDK